ncbi:MAG: hypothetical protein AAF492_10335, partial [Verrucomicrobiota bacterium]
EKGGGAHLEGPSFPLEPAMQKVFLSAYMPEENTYLGHTGPWNDELVWVLRGFTTRPRARMSNNDLINWVTSGLQVDRGHLQNFATDGVHLLYSTLRPSPGADGALKVNAAATLLVNAIVLLIILALGIYLLSRPLKMKVMWVGAFVIALLIISVFTPSFVRGLVTNGGITAGFIVVVVWCLWYLMVLRPRDPKIIAAKQAREEQLKARTTSRVNPSVLSDLAKDREKKKQETADADKPPPPAEEKKDEGGSKDED